MWRKLLRVLLVILGVLAAAIGAIVSYASWDWSRPVDVAYPPIEADRSPAGVARGAAIFHSTCEVCHRGGGSERATGAPLTDAPAFLGTFYAANLTAHPVAGAGALADKEIARLVRYGVDRRGRRTVMPSYAMGDADVAAVLGFLRSGDPMFAADPTPSPASQVSVLGKTVLLLAGATRVPDRPAQGIAVPEKAATVGYGRYLAHDVYDCVGCHTPGFSAAKVEGPELLEGGFEFRDPSGQPVFARNLTPDETGIRHYKSQDLGRALREGVRPNRTLLSAPMPMFRGLEDVEIEALYLYLQSVPARRNEGPGRTPPPNIQAPAPSSDPGARFRALGCVSCHGPGAAHAGAMARAVDKPAPDLARWIRNPERAVPGTPMPTYAGVIDEAQALELAQWIKSGGAKQLAER
ncbi:MAG: putative diheme cytochrome c-553 [Labilithrix sp.]|nr:putative diheme cytochrome c-553 [Labilithrix sp.]